LFSGAAGNIRTPKIIQSNDAGSADGDAGASVRQCPGKACPVAGLDIANGPGLIRVLDFYYFLHRVTN